MPQCQGPTIHDPALQGALSILEYSTSMSQLLPESDSGRKEEREEGRKGGREKGRKRGREEGRKEEEEEGDI